MHKTICCLAFSLFSTVAAAQNIKEGQWEFNNTMKMAGMPDIQLPPGMKLPGGIELGAGGMTITTKHCVTESQPAPPVKDQDRMKCEMKQQKREGGRFDWTQHCTGPNTDLTTTGSAKYDGDSMTSEMTSKGTVEGNPTEMTMKTTGRYLGACPAKK